MTDPCARWMELSDKQLVGEELSALELELIRLHELDCDQCAREAALFRELRTAPLHLVPSEEDVQRILLQAELNQGDQPSAVEPRSRPRRSSLRLAALAAAVVLAAGAWLYVSAVAKGGAQSVGATAALKASSGTHAANPAAGAGAVTNAPAAVPQDACTSVDDGIVLCLRAGSELGEIHTEGPQKTVELRRGRAVASLEPQPAGTSFSITTAAGKVTAVGTIFSVEVGHEGEVYASVTRGKVLVDGLGAAAAFSLTAGQMVRLGDHETSTLPALESQQDLDLVARWAATIADRRALERATSERAEPAAPDARSATNGGPRAATQDELGYARTLRMQGQFARAAAVYRSLYARSPRSESGRTALMSLASLQLSSLNDASGALASYDSYLAGGGGPLSEQAEYGRIRALHQLGQGAREREATRKFIARYPNAPETRLLQKRDSGPGGR